MAHILIAEDDQSMCSFLQLALEKAGHNVQIAYNGIDALKIIEESNPPIDLLLSDIVMPGMDGVELSNKATKTHPSIKIMFITGFAAVAMEREDLDREKTKVLSKPFHLNDLVEQVETLLST
ncbi:MAG TPA: response regulator [Alphaproteobacteria bacterium]|nr:response regulator [Alphaproteobacteria bacterium]USO05779.1 MAG: response regulator [Rhodospirillales bacterium]HOO81803.1 response regulator [Alphaproteobacteria bacterium]